MRLWNFSDAQLVCEIADGRPNQDATVQQLNFWRLRRLLATPLSGAGSNCEPKSDGG
jgi:hypothetical protein